MNGQLTFDLPALQAWSREDFVVSPGNALALATLEGDWTNRRLILTGPPGSGKTHLAHVWAAGAETIWLDPRDLGPALMVLPPEARVVIDDAHRVTDPEALFHLCNRLNRGALLLTAPEPPRDWVRLPDLLSRLQASSLARIEPPDDDLLSAILAKLFADRQVEVPPNLIPYLLPRMERSVEAARHLVGLLDARSLAQHRPITRALAAEVMDTEAAE
ncbi:DnaA ATPase domain-containing protein [Stagnihabitans tardus]|uniref:Chromosomal replication initiator DnaA n=1 Tax=Stagnihabitans tardus TaxID=2699202 RepID=A0AAE4YAX8_9RHOB|nr:DnaA/Hda family protein [Stagnihabitans tardus]NBZ86295.1 chromosomal replication initiator DnaA [Stagnihabitans tardus]